VSVSAEELRAVEEAVASHPDVLDVAAVALEGGLAAGVVPVDFASAPAIRDHAWETLGDGSAPRTVALLAALPRDSAGAVDRAELRRALAEDDLPLSTYAPPQTALEIEVAEVLREVLDLPRVGLDDDFLDLGGDSLRAIEVANLLQDRVGLQVTLEDVFDAATVRNLVRGAEA
jgi:acyl carrier protein